MKKIIISLMALFGMTTANAQITEATTATLQNGDNSAVFYGIDAFKTAIANAQDGAIITLSSGIFNVPANIDKTVKVYGAGMDDDATTGIAKTTLNGQININGVEGVQTDNIYMEGLYINGAIYIASTDDDQIENLKVVKCRFAGLDCRENSNHFIFRQCKVDGGMGGSSSVATGMMIQNCWISGLVRGFATESTVVVDHCFLAGNHDADNSSKWHGSYYFKNTIMYGSGATWQCNAISDGGVAVNCLSRFTRGGIITKTNCYAEIAWSDFFADGQNNSDYYVSDTTTPRTWALAAPETYVGDDNTQIGPAGGEFAWDIIPSTPRITQSNIASKTVNGKLSISIKAEARPVTE